MHMQVKNGALNLLAKFVTDHGSGPELFKEADAAITALGCVDILPPPKKKTKKRKSSLGMGELYL